MRRFVVSSSLTASLLLTACASVSDTALDNISLTSEAPDGLTTIVNAPVNNRPAKNVILFIGDGMGVSTITAGRIFDGQTRGESGEENSLSFETLPYSALVKTYNTNAQVPDSAGTASAMNMGIKTDIGVINERPGEFGHSCLEDTEALPMTLARQAEARGMSVGIISTARLTHATPAAVYAYTPNRGYESDSDLDERARDLGCKDIAAQLIDYPFGDGIELALGGGRRAFLPEQMGGNRSDGRDLTSEWHGDYVANGAEFLALDPMDDTPVLGLFTNSHMSYEADRDPGEEPSLADMTGFAIRKLEAQGGGYYLMIEAGRIDHAHHATNAFRALEDTQALSEAVAIAMQMVDMDETLILVTADHSHTFTIAGYPVRGNPILGLAYSIDWETGEPATEPLMDEDGKPYTTLGYQNGQNPRLPDSPALTDEDVLDPDFHQQSGVHLMSETHGGEDVALFAAGPRSHIVRGVIEQNLVYHIAAYALGWYDK